MDNLVKDDKYDIFVPIEDHDLMKSIEVDENGDYIVQGVMSSDDKDEEDDNIDPAGMDCSYFLQKGWIKYEHGKDPKQFIGEPLAVQVGKFQHPTLQKAVNGVFVKGRLFQSRDLTQQAVQAIEDLQKSNTTRRMGWSIEGNVKERDKVTGRVKKSILRNVVLTMNPVNTLTWAELQKSFAPDHSVVIDCEDMDKSMDIGAMAEVAPQSVEGSKPNDDEEAIKKAKEEATRAHNVFRAYLAHIFSGTSLKKSFIASSKEDRELMIYSFAIHKGLSIDTANNLTSFVSDNHEMIKSLIITGGEKMDGKDTDELMSLLKGDLDTLQKAISDDSDDSDDNDADEEDDKKDTADTDNDGDDEGDTDNDGDDEEDNSDDEDGDDGKMEKSLDGKSGLRKSLETDENFEKALEVSDFLSALVDEIGFGQEGLEKSLMKMTSNQTLLIKSFTSLAEVAKAQQETIAGLNASMGDLQKSFNDLLQRLTGRRGVVNQQELATITKGLNAGENNNGAKRHLSRMQISDVLTKSFEAGEIGGSAVSRFEAGVPLANLNLPDEVKAKLGM